MTATPYRARSWSPGELIGEDKMDQISNNVQWLFENTPRGTYTNASLSRAEGTRTLCGSVTIPTSKTDRASVTVRFPTFFTSGCKPIVTTSTVTQGTRHVWQSIHGITDLPPDDTGFVVEIEINVAAKKSDKILKAFAVHWIAMGY